MSIAIISNPNVNQPAYNQMVFDVSSTNAGQTNFNFIVDVYVSGINVSRSAYPKQPGTNKILIDISPVMKNYVTYDIENVYNTVAAANRRAQTDYYVQFGESYGSTPAIYADLKRFPNTLTDHVYNSIFDFEQFTPNILNSYKIETFGCLNINKTITIKQGQDLYISYYDPNLKVYSISTPKYGIIANPSVAGQFHYNLSIKWDDIVAWGLVASITAFGYLDIIFSDSLGNYVYGFQITYETCLDKFTMYRLHWMNQLGGWEAWNFDKVSTIDENIDRSQFKKFTPLNYSTNDRLKVNYNTVITDVINVQSNWVTDTEAAYLRALFESPLVILETSTNAMIPINITESNYESEKYLNGRTLHNVSLTFEYSYNRYRQSL